MSTNLGGTGVNDTLVGADTPDVITGLAGNDVIRGEGQGDLIHGDYADPNLLGGTEDARSFSGYAATGAWTVTALGGGHQQMTQTVQTEAGGVYSVSFALAANFAAGRTDAAVEIIVNGTVVETVTTQSGAFSDHSLQFTALGGTTEVTFRSVDGGGDGAVINTDGPAFYTEVEKTLGGQTYTVAAFADGQSNLYQVLNGTLFVYDTDKNAYEKAGADGTVNVNSLGFNAEDNLLFAIAVANGVDSQGNAVAKSDLVMIDAKGNSFLVGATPYRSWTGDFDDKGNLWSFEADMDRVTVIDVDQIGADGKPVTTVYKFDTSLVTSKYYDLAFDAGTQTFRGVSRPSAEGADTTLLIVDISSGVPVFSTLPVTSTVIDGVIHAGAPLMTFGAAIFDADGTLYVGGNGGDHDMNDATATSGGIYKVVIDPATNEASLVLVADAPKSYSNDGAADPTAESPFADIDLSSSVLLSDLSLVATVEGALTYDDTLHGGSGGDTVSGGIGDDVGYGDSAGDTLSGGDGNDALHGGSGQVGNGIVSIYDAAGNRFDQYGNALPEDDDVLYGGAGDDTLSGSAGHDLLDGGYGADILNGGSGRDSLYGADGDDVLKGGREADLLYGQDGADVLLGNSGDDTLAGGAQNDRLVGSSGRDRLMGDDGADTLDGGSGDDVLTGGNDADRLKGGSGNDLMDGDAGQDYLNGGTGADTLDGGSGNDRLLGGSGNDSVAGGSGNDYLNGWIGDDVLDGGSGRDRLYLGAGNDTATGGADADRFVFRSHDLDGGQDVITDFSGADGDVLDLRQLDLLANGLSASEWLSGNAERNAEGDVSLALGQGTLLSLEGLGLSQDVQLQDLAEHILF